VAFRWHTKTMWKALRARLILEAADRRAAWEAMQDRFKQNWPQTKIAPRVVVHLPSLSHPESARASMPNLDVAQSAQLPRLCEVIMQGVDVIYVSPFPLHEDVAAYYQKASAREKGGDDVDPHKWTCVLKRTRSLARRPCPRGIHLAPSR
jgi:hypothetical protein